MAVAPRTVIVTGANRGIGLAISTLLLSHPETYGAIKLIATTRQGKPLNLPIREPAKQEVLYPALDIEHSESIRSFADWVRRERGQDGRGQAVLINNAGVYLKDLGGEDVEKATKTLRVNYRGTREMCERLIPHFAPESRIVNISSVASSIKDYAPSIRARFRDSNLDFTALDKLAEEYLTALRTSTSSSSSPFGPPNRAYNFSKACVNATTRLLASQHPQLRINACCPGWIATDMGVQVGPKPPKTPEEGAAIPLRLAFGDLGGVSGAYWANASPRGRGLGEVREWDENGEFVVV